MTARHSCRVPADRTRIRILRQGLTREQANHWEAFYIARFGRKADGGMLLNTRLGGDGGAHDAETNARIAAKVRERYREGVFAKLNGRDAIDRRRRQRAVNKAIEFGIPVDTYLGMTTTRRDQAKAWLKAHPGQTFADWEARSKAAMGAARDQAILALRRQGLTQAEIGKRLQLCPTVVSRRLKKQLARMGEPVPAALGEASGGYCLSTRTSVVSPPLFGGFSSGSVMLQQQRFNWTRRCHLLSARRNAILPAG